MNRICTVLFAALLVTSFFSCRKKDDPAKPVIVPPVASNVTLKFTNMVGSRSLDLGKTVYTNEHGDSFTVSTYQYYISNVSVSTADGQEYKEPESYHLLRQSVPESLSFTIHGLPAGNYTKVKFLIGVDEARNTSGAQTGDLDPSLGMFWDWNTGYVMARIEGKSPQSTLAQMVAFHLGGFTGPYSVLRWVTLTLPTAAVVADGKLPVVNIKSDVLEWFKTPNTIDFSKLSVLTNGGPDASNIADNYADMFSIDHVDN